MQSSLYRESSNQDEAQPATLLPGPTVKALHGYLSASGQDDVLPGYELDTDLHFEVPFYPEQTCAGSSWPSGRPSPSP